MKKEFRRFVSSPVFVINAGFGLVLFVIACVASVVKSDFIMQAVGQMLGIMPEEAIKYVPVVLLALIIVTSLMSSITSSMISLEGKSFNIIKVLPVKPFTIIFAKVLTAVSVIIPVLLVGDLIIFLFYKVSLLNMLMIIVASIVLPFVAELIGIIVNLKYPKMDANNDTEVVKQSTSSAVAVFAGMFLAGITIFGLFYFVTNIPVSLIVALGLSFYTLLFALLMLYLKHKGVEDFESINVP
jgi:ABC-2 type transport system permease protein